MFFFWTDKLWNVGKSFLGIIIENKVFEKFQITWGLEINKMNEDIKILEKGIINDNKGNTLTNESPLFTPFKSVNGFIESQYGSL